MDYAYPLLNKVFNYYRNHKIDLSNFFLYSCQHLLAPQYEMYRMFIQFGFKPEFNGISFNKEHIKNCKSLTKNISNKNKNIILDDGGYLIDESKTKNIYFAVEQTSSGFNLINNQIYY